MIKIGVLISGSGSNLQSIIEAVNNGSIVAEIALVISNNEEAYGLTRAENYGILTKVIKHGDFGQCQEFDQELLRVLKENRVDLVVLAGFMRVLGAAFLAAFPDRVINIHPAILPSFPGTHGQEQAFDYGVKLAGCTVHFVDEKVDHGPIIIQAAVPVLSNDSEDCLGARILRCEHKIFPRALALYCAGNLRIEDRKVKISGVDESALEDQFLISC
ncbi:MAG: phosphoribosylglycinamide formyltransferase [Deltaproteobacteria bacterium]|nr:phosphoribosylglycinamide formyltransferase [Candidatus Tharpella sp.]